MLNIIKWLCALINRFLLTEKSIFDVYIFSIASLKLQLSFPECWKCQRLTFVIIQKYFSLIFPIFKGWAGKHVPPPSIGNEATCVILKNEYPCNSGKDFPKCKSNYFFWTAEDCSKVYVDHFICERPHDDIGKIGKPTPPPLFLPFKLSHFN